MCVCVYVYRMEDLSPAEQEVINHMVSEARRISAGAAAAGGDAAMSAQDDDGVLMSMSTLSEEGVMAVKTVSETSRHM